MIIYSIKSANNSSLFPSRVQRHNWLIFRYPMASMMLAYIFILILVGLSRTRLFQKFYGKYFKDS